MGCTRGNEADRMRGESRAVVANRDALDLYGIARQAHWSASRIDALYKAELRSAPKAFGKLLS